MACPAHPSPRGLEIVSHVSCQASVNSGNLAVVQTELLGFKAKAGDAVGHVDSLGGQCGWCRGGVWIVRRQSGTVGMNKENTV